MSKISDSGKYLPHKVSEVICVKCGERWIAVRPADTFLRHLECENCGRGYVIETGQEINQEDTCLQ